MLVLLCAAELMSMSVWFSVSAVSSALQVELGFSAGEIAWLVMAVQFGFVVGTLLLAFANLSDVFNIRALFAISATAAAVFNLSFIYIGDNLVFGMLLRFLAGFVLAGVYPPGMRIVAGWFDKARGLGIGALVGALTIGKALPHWLGSVPSGRWQATIIASSALSLLAGLIVIVFVKDGPFHRRAARFNFKYAWTVLRDRPTRLAYFGYFGHMWELYAMWTWVPVFLKEVFQKHAGAFSGGLAAFLVIAAGAFGSVLYGLWADRIGRSISTITAMAISGLCCLTLGYLEWLAPIWLLTLCIIWGITVVADSAQFSAAVTELCEPEYTGTALTLQTSLGFLITMFSIKLVPELQSSYGWGVAFMSLGLGPLAGIFAMFSLYRMPEALRMASGNR